MHIYLLCTLLNFSILKKKKRFHGGNSILKVKVKPNLKFLALIIPNQTKSRVTLLERFPLILDI